MDYRRARRRCRGGWSSLELVREFPLHFLAGLVDSDGYVGEHYIGIIQKRFRFLVRIRRFARQNADFHFKGPYVNKRRDGHITSWIISIHRREERERFLKATSQLIAGMQTKADKWL